jgi:hypothetical protein
MHSIGPETKIIICCPTYSLDPTYVDLIAKLKRKGHQVEAFYDIVDDDGTNIIDQFLANNTVEDSDDEDDSKEPVRKVPYKPHHIRITTLQPDQSKQSSGVRKGDPFKRTVKKSKLITPKYIIIVDDCGKNMRNLGLEKLLKTNRHYRTMTITSGQDLNDLTPAMIKQLQYILLFPRFPDEKLRRLHELLSLTVDYDTFARLYANATAKKYNFLYIGRDSQDEFRHNFDKKFILAHLGN